MKEFYSLSLMLLFFSLRLSPCDNFQVIFCWVFIFTRGTSYLDLPEMDGFVGCGMFNAKEKKKKKRKQQLLSLGPNWVVNYHCFFPTVEASVVWSYFPDCCCLEEYLSVEKCTKHAYQRSRIPLRFGRLKGLADFQD